MHPLKIAAAVGISLSAFALLGVGFVMSTAPTPATAVQLEPENEPELVPAAGALGAEAPGAEAPGAEALGAEAPGAEALGAEALGAEDAADEPSAATEAAPDGPTVEMPELEGRTALRALRRLRALGLVADIVDPDGRSVPVIDRRYVAITEQTVAPGARVEEGATVRLVAREPRLSFASGY